MRAPSPALRELGRLCRAGTEGRPVGSPVDFATIDMLARRHRVEGWTSAALGRVDAVRTAAARGLEQAAECRRLADALGDVRPLFLKGLAVSALAHPQPFLKQSADIDLLVEPEFADRAADILTSLGYRLVRPHSPARLERWYGVDNQSIWQSGKFMLDLHVRPLIIPFKTSESTLKVDVLPDLELTTFGLFDQYRYLALHGALGGWFRLKWLVDFAAIVEKQGRPIAATHRAATELGAGLASAQALVLSRQILDLALDPELLDVFERDKRVIRFANLAMDLLERDEPWTRRFGTLPIHRSALLLETRRFGAVRRIADLVAQRWLA